MPSILSRSRPNATFTSADLNRRPNGTRLGMPPPVPTGDPISSGFSTTSASGGKPPTTSYVDFLAKNPGSPAATGSLAGGAPTPAPAGILRPAPAPTAAPPDALDVNGLEPGSFAMQNMLANARVYQPGTFGAQNAQANNTGYRAPQQTERANPLSGDNNVPMEGVTTPVSTNRLFSQRGSRLPSGQDAIGTTATMDQDISKNLNGSILSKRSFAQPVKQSDPYGDYISKLYGS